MSVVLYNCDLVHSHLLCYYCQQMCIMCLPISFTGVTHFTRHLATNCCYHTHCGLLLVRMTWLISFHVGLLATQGSTVNFPATIGHMLGTAFPC